jgi:hypothetical protein
VRRVGFGWLLLQMLEEIGFFGRSFGPHPQAWYVCHHGREIRFMKKLLLSTVLFAAVLNQSAVADDRMGDDRRNDEKFTVAVFGDWPYNQNLLTNAPLLVNSINADPDVSLIIHVGDIHSGSMACTSAGILPPIPTSNPGWNQPVYY